MFSTVLIANRGEIACRIVRTLQRMGIRAVTVHSEADERAAHVAAADAAMCVGPPPVAESYLDQEAVLRAAVAMGAQAVHPGYGLLSENADFARRCHDAGLTFIGPSARAIAAMGDKAEARRRMAEAGVPVVPGTNGPVRGAEALTAAENIGFPLLVKAAGGWGGIGMKVVKKASKLERAVQSCADRGTSSFGNDSVYLERYVSPCHHVEVQVLFDTNGTGIHLYERECSIQRRHQKVVEEAGSPLLQRLGSEVRERMGEAAVRAAQAIGYSNAGTVEYVVSPDGEFYFIEMNTRLQVEHPVTEMTTGVDLVEQQVRLAAGEPLTLSQADIVPTGHAIECRIYAEDPSRRFLPSPGTLESLRMPEGNGMRCDFGYREGDAVTPYYDPLLGKVVAHGADRPAALHRMRQALDGLTISGIRTNGPMLRRLMDHPDFVAGRCDTSFLEAHIDSLLDA